MNKNNYDDGDIIVRKARIDDNFEELAQLIYETDSYIYPYWFHDDVEEAKRVLPTLMKEDGFFFNYQSMYIAVDKKSNKIVGLVSVVEPSTNLDYDYDDLRANSESYRFIIDNYVMKLIMEVKELGLPYISNVCVDPEYRGRKIGQLMFEKVIEEKKDFYRKLLLDVLANNPSAISVYKKAGFEITDSYMDIGYGPNNYVAAYSMELDTSKKRK